MFGSRHDRQMYANGDGASLRQIAAALTERKIPPPHGSRWYASSVQERMFQERMARFISAQQTRTS